MSEEPRIRMRSSYRAVGLAHVLLGFFLALGFIGSVYSFTELAGVAWDFRLFFYLSFIISVCLFALFQLLVRDAGVRRLWVRRLLLGVHFPLGLYLLPYLILPILARHPPSFLALIFLAFIVLIQIIDRELWSILGRIIMLLLGILVSYITIIIILIMGLLIEVASHAILILFFH